MGAGGQTGTRSGGTGRKDRGSSMDHGTARETKAQAVDYARELSEQVIRPSDVADGGPAESKFVLKKAHCLGLTSLTE